jgi:uncharacterized membrane protein YphA (DoxX/SURF4 family)
MDSIEIMTAQNVRIEYTLATLRERIVAAIMDMLVVACLLFGLWMLFASLNLFQLQTTYVLIGVLSWGGLYILYQFTRRFEFGGHVLFGRRDCHDARCKH